MPEIVLKDVKVRYQNKKSGDTVALNGFSACFESDEISVIIGRSGCGKTTLLKTVAGLIDYDGSASIGGKEIKELSSAEKNVAYVFQEYALYPHMTAFENIAFPLRIAGAGRDEIISRVNDVAKKLDIDYYLSRKPRQLSGGQKQRVVLARALVKRPSVILMDEPLSNLDAQARASARIFIRQTLKKFGGTTLFVTHDLTEATAMADKIFVMDEGKLVLTGTPAEIYDSNDQTVKGLFDANAFV